MSSCDQRGWRTGPRGANSVIYGLRSSTGEPSIASRPRTVISMPLTSSSSHVHTPIRFGRRLLRCAKNADRRPLGVSPRSSGPNLVGVCRDLIEDVDDIDVRELVEALERVGREPLAVEAHARYDFTPVVIDRLGPGTCNPADRKHREHGPQCRAQPTRRHAVAHQISGQFLMYGEAAGYTLAAANTEMGGRHDE